MGGREVERRERESTTGRAVNGAVNSIMTHNFALMPLCCTAALLELSVLTENVYEHTHTHTLALVFKVVFTVLLWQHPHLGTPENTPENRRHF